jgi:hypothetical protein
MSSFWIKRIFNDIENYMSSLFKPRRSTPVAAPLIACSAENKKERRRRRS